MRTGIMVMCPASPYHRTARPLQAQGLQGVDGQRTCWVSHVPSAHGPPRTPTVGRSADLVPDLATRPRPLAPALGSLGM